MSRVLMCIGASLSLCLAGCGNNAALKERIKALKKENAELKAKLGNKSVPPAPGIDDWKYPDAQSGGSSSSGGGSERPGREYHEVVWMTADDYDKVLAFYADKMKLDKDWVSESPWVQGTMGGGNIMSVNSPPKGGVGREAEGDGDKRVRPVRCQCLTKRTPSYDISVFLTRGESEKHTYVLIVYNRKVPIS